MYGRGGGRESLRRVQYVGDGFEGGRDGLPVPVQPGEVDRAEDCVGWWDGPGGHLNYLSGWARTATLHESRNGARKPSSSKCRSLVRTSVRPSFAHRLHRNAIDQAV